MKTATFMKDFHLMEAMKQVNLPLQIKRRQQI